MTKAQEQIDIHTKEIKHLESLVSQESVRMRQLTKEVIKIDDILSLIDKKLDRVTDGKKSFFILASLCTGALFIATILFLVIRLGPEGYSRSDAQADRDRLCVVLKKMHPEQAELCPIIQGQTD